MMTLIRLGYNSRPSSGAIDLAFIRSERIYSFALIFRVVEQGSDLLEVPCSL